jgi:hypothetical protein
VTSVLVRARSGLVAVAPDAGAPRASTAPAARERPPALIVLVTAAAGRRRVWTL